MPTEETKGKGAPLSFAAKLKAIRDSAGLTQAQLAEKSGLHLGAVFKLEQGQREPSWATVQALAHALGVSCEVFQTDAPRASDQAEGKPAGSKRTAATEPKKGKKQKG